MAEVIARRRADELGWHHVEVRSAGVAALAGAPASGGAVRTAAAHGLDLSGHRSRQLTAHDIEGADLILAMSTDHLLSVIELGGGERAALLSSYAGGHPAGFPATSVPDPIGGPDEEYEETYRLLQEMIERALERLQPVLSR
jgi:protein-tyrosine-phosphatase